MHTSHVTTEYPCTSWILIRNYRRRNDKNSTVAFSVTMKALSLTQSHTSPLGVWRKDVMSNKHFLFPRTLEQTTTEYHKRNEIYTMNTLNTMSIINTTSDQILHDCPQNTIIYIQCNHTGRHLQSCYMYEFLLNTTTNSELIVNTYTIKWIYSSANTKIQYTK